MDHKLKVGTLLISRDYGLFMIESITLNGYMLKHIDKSTTDITDTWYLLLEFQDSVKIATKNDLATLRLNGKLSPEMFEKYYKESAI